MTACGECLLDRHGMCPDLDQDDVQASDYDDGEGGEYEEVFFTCCCGEGWSEVRETVASEYRRMDEASLKTLQYPDMPQATEQNT
jgi:hypothetical protein